MRCFFYESYPFIESFSCFKTHLEDIYTRIDDTGILTILSASAFTASCNIRSYFMIIRSAVLNIKGMFLTISCPSLSAWRSRSLCARRVQKSAGHIRGVFPTFSITEYQVIKRKLTKPVLQQDEHRDDTLFQCSILSLVFPTFQTGMHQDCNNIPGNGARSCNFPQRSTVFSISMFYRRAYLRPWDIKKKKKTKKKKKKKKNEKKSKKNLIKKKKKKAVIPNFSVLFW